MQPQIIDKIRKLFAQAESEKTIGNEAAASAFSAKVQELLDKYNLEMSDVELAEAEAGLINGERIPLATDKFYVWQSHLLTKIAVLNGCAAFSSEDNAILFGREPDRRIVAEFFGYFERLALDLAAEAEQAYRIHRRGWFFLQAEEHFADFRQSFLAGFVVVLCHRMEAVRVQTRASVHAAENALLVTDRRSNEAFGHVTSKYPVDLQARSAENPRSQSGFYSGADAGGRVALSTKRIEG